jgi:shikimate kinase
MQWMNNNGTTIYLNAPTIILYKNLLQEIEKRPLLSNITDTALETTIKNKLNERLPFYSLSKIVLQQKDLTETGFLEVLKNYKDG